MKYTDTFTKKYEKIYSHYPYIFNCFTFVCSKNYAKSDAIQHMDKVTDDFKTNNLWCNCIREKDNQYIGTIPMVGYGSTAYILTLYAFYAN